MIKIKSPIINATARPMTVSKIENSETFSRKLDLKISLNVIDVTPYLGGRNV